MSLDFKPSLNTLKLMRTENDLETEILYSRFAGEKKGLQYIIRLLWLFLLYFAAHFAVIFMLLFLLSIGVYTEALSLSNIGVLSAVLASICALFFINNQIREKNRIKKLLQYGVHSAGKLISFNYDKEDIVLLKYSYKDENEREYNSEWSLQSDLLYNFHVGDECDVYYLRADPSQSILDLFHCVKEFEAGKREESELEDCCGLKTTPVINRFNSFDFMKKYYLKMKIFYPTWWVYIAFFLIWNMETFVLFFAGEFRFPNDLRYVFMIWPVILFFLCLEMAVHQIINYCQYRNLKVLYSQGVCTEGTLLGYETSLMSKRRTFSKDKFPILKVWYKFRLPSGKECSAVESLPVPKKLSGINVNANYPVYYIHDKPKNCTIDIFGFTQ